MLKELLFLRLYFVLSLVIHKPHHMLLNVCNLQPLIIWWDLVNNFRLIFITVFWPCVHSENQELFFLSFDHLYVFLFCTYSFYFSKIVVYLSPALTLLLSPCSFILFLRFINARRRILQPMLDASNPDPAPKAKKMKSQHRPTQRFWPDSIVAGVLQTHRSQTGNNSDSMSALTFLYK